MWENPKRQSATISAVVDNLKYEQSETENGVGAETKKALTNRQKFLTESVDPINV